MVSKNIYTTAFEGYKNLGLDPLPIPYDENGHPTKGPKIPGWQIKAANRGYTEEDFSEPCNIGVLLGGAKNLTDIDCDSVEAVAIGAEILEHLMDKTGKTMMFGRTSKRRSHYVFFCDTSLASEQVVDPDDHKMIVEYRCVKQDGERGIQTVFPPSLWYEAGTTEKIQLEDDSTSVPTLVKASHLHEHFRLIAAVALLAKHFPVAAERHNTILALAGIFARSGMPEGKAAIIVKLAYRHSKGYNGDQNKAEGDVKSVYTTLEKGTTTHLFGYPKLTEIMPRMSRSMWLLMRRAWFNRRASTKLRSRKRWRRAWRHIVLALLATTPWSKDWRIGFRFDC